MKTTIISFSEKNTFPIFQRQSLLNIDKKDSLLKRIYLNISRKNRMSYHKFEEKHNELFQRIKHHDFKNACFRDTISLKSFYRIKSIRNQLSLKQSCINFQQRKPYISLSTSKIRLNQLNFNKSCEKI